MKFLIATLILTASTAFASSPMIEPGPVTEIQVGHGVMTALLKNPQIAEELGQEYVTEVRRVTQQAIAPGYTQYRIYTSTCGNCLPKTAQVIINEDVTPTYRDGAIKYDINI